MLKLFTSKEDKLKRRLKKISKNKIKGISGKLGYSISSDNGKLFIGTLLGDHRRSFRDVMFIMDLRKSYSLDTRTICKIIDETMDELAYEYNTLVIDDEV